MAIKDNVAGYIARHGLLDKRSTCLVALSGGADSVALLLLLRELGYAVEAAHCNFHLRGEESDRDEDFVKCLCHTNNVPLHIVHFDTKAYASLHKVSIEMAARRLRYAYFKQLLGDIGAAAVCVAHHQNDNVETVLMNLMRGTGIHGLVGIRPKNGFVVRPLLCLSRSDIEQYLGSRGQGYVTDSTNLVPDVVRNKIRLELIPLMKTIYPEAVGNIQRTSGLVAEAEKVYDAAIADSVSMVTGREGSLVYVDIDRLKQQPSPEATLFEILQGYGFSSQHAEQVYLNIDAAPGKVYSSGGYDLAIDRGRMLISEKREPCRDLRMPEPGVYVYGDGRKLRLDVRPVDASFAISRQGCVASVDAADVAFPLTLRHVREGDRFVPFGMKGSKLVSDYLTDRKRNLFQKRGQLVVEDATGKIVWLVGERVDNRCRITGESKSALIMSFVEEP